MTNVCIVCVSGAVALAATYAGFGEDARDVALRVANALDGVENIRYVVESDCIAPNGLVYRGRTIVLVSIDPFRFRAEQYDDRGRLISVAVSRDNETISLDAAGRSDSPTLIGTNMVVSNEATLRKSGEMIAPSLTMRIRPPCWTAYIWWSTPGAKLTPVSGSNSAQRIFFGP